MKRETGAVVLGVIVAALAAWAGAALSGAAGVAGTDGAAMLGDGAVVAQRAPEMDPNTAERERERRQREIDAAVRKARAGKATVLRVEPLKIGEREMTSALLESNEGRRTALVPCFQDKLKRWHTQADIVKALKDVPRGFYEVIHTEEKYGLLWVCGVGELSPKNLDNLEKFVKGRQWKPLVRRDDPTKPGDAGDVEVVRGTAVGRFVEMTRTTLDGKNVRKIVIERGVMMTRTELWMANLDRKYGARLSREAVKLSDELKQGDMVRIDYVRIGERMYVTAMVKEE